MFKLSDTICLLFIVISLQLLETKKDVKLLTETVFL